MVQVDLITGFLGSGKTTFIKKYARYLMEQGQNIGILENDFGAINVDMMLLRELEVKTASWKWLQVDAIKTVTGDVFAQSLLLWECADMTVC